MNSRQSGFTLLAVLVLATFVTTMAIGYAHHVLVDQRASLATTSNVAAREQAQSAVAYARQAVTSGQSAQSVMSGDGVSTGIQVAQLPGGHQSIQVATTMGNGLGRTVLIESSLVARSQSAPDDAYALPNLAPQVVTDMAADPSVTQHVFSSGVTTLSDTDIDGLIILQAGAELHLVDVVIKGAIVSQTVMDQAAPIYNSLAAPTVVIDGDLRIDPGAFLPGVAIVMPDGVVTTSAYSASLQIVGDIVAHEVTLDRGGAAHGNIIAVDGASLSDELELIGRSRRPQDWADSIELNGSWATDYMAVIPHVPDAASIAAISDYWSSP